MKAGLLPVGCLSCVPNSQAARHRYTYSGYHGTYQVPGTVHRNDTLVLATWVPGLFRDSSVFLLNGLIHSCFIIIILII